MKIVTEHVYPPIPIRNFDWAVYDDDTYCGCGECHNITGEGPTLDAAMIDFTERWLEENEIEVSGRLA